jgi:hypothetical protein
VNGAEGAKVQAFFVKPPDFDAAKKYPVLMLLHGGPQGAWGESWTYRWNAPGFRRRRLCGGDAQSARVHRLRASL